LARDFGSGFATLFTTIVKRTAALLCECDADGVVERDADLASDDENLLSDGLDLADDFSRLLLWDFYGFLLANSLSEADLQATAGLFEQQADRFYLLFRSTVNKLHQFLLGIN
jgi:hypothetical protein